MTIKNTIPKVVKISGEEIIIRGLRLSNSISKICHEQKHLYKEGYRCGRKTRKQMGKRTKKWEDCPEICFTYLFTDDFDEDKEYGAHNGFLKIKILVSDRESLRKKYSNDEIAEYAYKFALSIADRIEEQLIYPKGKQQQPPIVKAAVTL